MIARDAIKCTTPVVHTIPYIGRQNHAILDHHQNHTISITKLLAGWKLLRYNGSAKTMHITTRSQVEVRFDFLREKAGTGHWF